MFGGSLGDALSFGDLCGVYKAGCCRSSGLGKKQVSLRHKRTKATKQDLGNHILEHRCSGMDMFPTPQPSELAIYEPSSLSHFVTRIVRWFHSVVVITFGSDPNNPGSNPGGTSFCNY